MLGGNALLITDVDVLCQRSRSGMNVAVNDGRFCYIGKQIPDGDWAKELMAQSCHDTGLLTPIHISQWS